MNGLSHQPQLSDGHLRQLADEPLDAALPVPGVGVGQRVLDVAVQVELPQE